MIGLGISQRALLHSLATFLLLAFAVFAPSLFETCLRPTLLWLQLSPSLVSQLPLWGWMAGLEEVDDHGRHDIGIGFGYFVWCGCGRPFQGRFVFLPQPGR